MIGQDHSYGSAIELARLRADNLTAHQMACAAGLERDQLRAEVERLTVACDKFSNDEIAQGDWKARAERAEAESVQLSVQLRDQLTAARQWETVAIASWDEERGRALREGARVVELKARAEKAEAEVERLKKQIKGRP